MGEHVHQPGVRRPALRVSQPREVGPPQVGERLAQLGQLLDGQPAAEVAVDAGLDPLRRQLGLASDMLVEQLAVAPAHLGGEGRAGGLHGRRDARAGPPAVAQGDRPPRPLPAGAALGLLDEAVLRQRPQVERARRGRLPDVVGALGGGQRPAQRQLLEQPEPQRVSQRAHGQRVVAEVALRHAEVAGAPAAGHRSGTFRKYSFERSRATRPAPLISGRGGARTTG